MSAHTARVNALSGGQINALIFKELIFAPILNWVNITICPNRIDCGALADQNVVSLALQSLLKTIYPSHAVVGSGLYENSVSGSPCSIPFGIGLEQVPFDLFWTLMYGDPLKLGIQLNQEELDRRNGPYCLGSGSLFGGIGTARRLVNYVFNNSHEQGAQPSIENPLPWPNGDAPNYDLTARLSSMRGGLEGDAVTDVRHLGPNGRVSDEFIGKLTHLTEIGDTDVARELARRIAFLLRQPTASIYFSRFPAVCDAMDEFDDEMMIKFNLKQVEAELRVLPNYSSPLPPCFEDEARERLENGENGLFIIRNHWMQLTSSP